MTINDFGGVLVLLLAGIGTFSSTYYGLPKILDFIDKKKKVSP